MVSISFDSDTKNAIAALETSLVGAFSFLETANAKPGFSTARPIEQKIAFVIARIIGSQNTAALYRQLNMATGPLPEVGVNLLGPLNATTGSGIGVLVLDNIARRFKVPYYSKVGVFIRALGAGLTIGGFLGGLLDAPAANGNVINMVQRSDGSYEAPRRLW